MEVGAKTPNFGCFFISPTERVGKTDFRQLLITTFKWDWQSTLIQLQRSKLKQFDYCHLNSFLVIMICIDVWREVGCLLTLNNLYKKNCCEYIWDEEKECQKWCLISIKDWRKY